MRLRHGQRISVAVRVRSGHHYAAELPVALAWHVGCSQYYYPCRVVAVEQRGHDSALKVYNESTRDKPRLAIDHVLLDGNNITAHCRLPTDMLPADRQRYEADLREIIVPSLWNGRNRRTITIGFHLVAEASTIGASTDAAGGVEANSARGQRGAVSYVLVKGLGLPVGCDGSPVLDGCVSVHDGGLRPPMSRDALRRLAINVRAIVPEMPIYARLNEGLCPTDIIAVGDACDFLVVAPSHRARLEGADANRDFFSYHRALCGLRVPFVTSIGGDGVNRLTRDELSWLVLSALASGSKGARLPRPDGDLVAKPNVSFDALFDGQRAVSISSASPLAELLCAALPAELPRRANADGVACTALLRGPDTIVVFALNEWNTRRLARWDGDFYCAPRPPCEVIVGLPPLWRVGSANELGAGGAVRFRQESSGDVILSIPALRRGRAIVLKRTAPRRAASGDDVATVKHGAPVLPETDLAGPVVYPINSPFIKLGMQPVGIPSSVKIRVRNDGARAVTLSAKADLSRSSGLSVTATSCRIPARDEADLLLEVDGLPPSGHALAALRIEPREAPVAGFTAFVEAADVQQPIEAEPHAIDFGAFSDRTAIRPPVVTVRSRVADRALIDLSVKANGPLIADVDAHSHSVRVRPSPSADGAFAGRLVIRAAFAGSPAAHETTVEVYGRRQSTAPRHRVPARIPQGASDRDGDFASAGRLRLVSRSVDQVLKRIRDADVSADAPNWAMMHALLLFGSDAWAQRDQRRNVHDLLQRLLSPADPSIGPFTIRDGLLFPRQDGMRLGREHHRDQFLQLLSVAHVPLDAAVTIRDRVFSVRDLFESSRRELTTRGELSKTVSAYSYYARPGDRWKNKFGQELSMGALVARLLENSEDFCGGTHRLFAIARIAARDDWWHDPTLTGLRQRVSDSLAAERKNLRRRQQADGSFARPRSEAEDSRQAGIAPAVLGLHYTGHSFEWLMVAPAADDLLKRAWIVAAAEYLVAAIERLFPGEAFRPRFDTVEQGFTYGFMAHAVSGLRRWHDAVEAEKANQPPRALGEAQPRSQAERRSSEK